MMKAEIENKIKELEKAVETHKSNFIAASGALEVLKELLIEKPKGIEESK